MWEYKIVKIEAKGILFPNVDSLDERELNSLGRQGWELVQIVDMTKGGGRTSAMYMYFKRSVQ